MKKNEESVEEVVETVEADEVELVNDEELKEELEAEQESEEVKSETKDEQADSAKELDETSKIAVELVKAEAACKDATDRYQRTMAEFDNFRKRTLKEKSQMFENGAKEVLEKLLPVVDNFERAFDHISDDEKDLAITQGVEMIYKQLMGALSELGVEEIEAKGAAFDPELHHAVSHEEDDDYDENMVQEVFQKGYMYKDAVLRYSMVKVVN